MENEEHQDRLGVIVAVLIALAIVIGAIVVWRASVAQDAYGDADYAGLRASINVEETRALNHVTVYANYRTFTVYQRYNELGDSIAADLSQAPPGTSEAEAAQLERQRADAHDLALVNQDLFPNRFLNRDGTYNIQRQLGELWADAAKQKDLNPEPQFVEADRLREKTTRFLVAVMVLSIAVVCYTLVESVGGRLKIGLAALGLAFMLAGTGAALFIEFRL